MKININYITSRKKDIQVKVKHPWKKYLENVGSKVCIVDKDNNRIKCFKRKAKIVLTQITQLLHRYIK